MAEHVVCYSKFRRLSARCQQVIPRRRRHTGGAIDPVARALAAKLPALLGQPLVIDNRPGANTAIAAGAVARADDAYTLLLTSTNTHAIHTIQAPRGYDAITGFTPIAGVSRGDFLMAINASIPATTLPEFIAYAKARPGQISAGAASLGNADHLSAELFKLATGVELTTVAYKGAGPALLDLLAGRVQMMITTKSLVQSHIDAGKLRMLAYTDRPADQPGVPTFAQHGLKDFDTFGLMTMVLAPPNMPAPVVAKLTAAIQRALETPETQAALAAVNQRAAYLSPSDLRARMVSDGTRFADIIQKARIKFE
ncbi:MAG: tripartite tricarboxylate transporter substrate binding protein [Comamonadaceae bacterium]|nr:MAG: tripartite tricarboxylate transporter substrate binding protein [Comamonadaceae bacterium]